MAETADPNKLFKALAKLKAMKTNINPSAHTTNEKYTREYNETVSEIADILQDDLSSFIVPDNEIKPKVTGRSTSTGTRYSSENWTETSLVLIKLDGVINYFEMLLQNEEPKKPIGFRSEY